LKKRKRSEDREKVATKLGGAPMKKNQTRMERCVGLIFLVAALSLILASQAVTGDLAFEKIAQEGLLFDSSAPNSFL
jgi:hypothetical protein